MKKITKAERGAKAKRLVDLGTCYSDDDLKNILKAFKINVYPVKHGSIESEFKKSLEIAAWLLVNATAEELLEPGERIKALEDLDAKMRAATRALSAAMSDLYLAAHLRAAARGISRQSLEEAVQAFRRCGEASAPDPEFRPERVLQKMPAYFGRAHQTTREAHRRVTAEIGKGGNRADESLHEFIRSVAELYEKTASNPQLPKGARLARGEFIKLLQACLRPLGIDQSDEALVKTFLRATQA